MSFPGAYTKLCLTSLTWRPDEGALRAWIERAAPIADLRINSRRDGSRSRRLAFVDTHDHEAARRIVEQLNGEFFEGRRVYVTPAPARPELHHAHDPIPPQDHEP